MAIELTNNQLEESNRVILKSLSVAQEDNRRYRKEITELKMQYRKYAVFGFGKMRSLRKIKNEKRELCEMEERVQLWLVRSLISKRTLTVRIDSLTAYKLHE